MLKTSYDQNLTKIKVTYYQGWIQLVNLRKAIFVIFRSRLRVPYWLL